MAEACEKRAVRGKKRRSLPIKSRRKGFAPVEMGLLEQEAIQEAQRCLGVRECESCDLCTLLCPDLCITRNEKTGEMLFDLDYCKGCGICAAICPKGAIRMVLEESA
jgi:2-oxoacid:acceptor oxidoreductase delta subunit (pyruvate/2-ketoisovalerate family)